ncbi:MAG TPA: hypothetical protein VIH82_01190 [Acidimicrobiia bacterium]
MTRVGILAAGGAGGARGAAVDAVGVVAADGLGWELDWRIGADDRWRMPQRETAVRQSLVRSAPVVRTAMRVPGGDAVADVYGAAEGGGLVVVEVTNDSPAPFVVAFVVRAARSVMVSESVVVVDRRPGLVLSRVPSRWSVTRGGSTDIEVCGGAAREGAFPATRDRAGRVEAAFLLPVPHRASIRAGIVPAGTTGPVDLGHLPSADEAARGWAAQLRRGMRVEVPDGRVSEALAAARAQTLLEAQQPRPPGLAIAALEDWGFDQESTDAWQRTGARERRVARHRPARPPHAHELDTLLDRARTPGGVSRVAAELLRCARALLVWESGGDELVLLSELPTSWQGRDVDVQDAPTRAGPVSFAVRWHGDRPALLWAAPPGVHVRAPGLDAEWSTDVHEGEALLAGSAA